MYAFMYNLRTLRLIGLWEYKELLDW
jgi:hypothetical protein